MGPLLNGQTSRLINGGYYFVGFGPIQFLIDTLPETNSSHLKIGGWKMNFLLGVNGPFSGANLPASFQGG